MPRRGVVLCSECERNPSEEGGAWCAHCSRAFHEFQPRHAIAIRLAADQIFFGPLIKSGDLGPVTPGDTVQAGTYEIIGEKPNRRLGKRIA